MGNNLHARKLSCYRGNLLFVSHTKWKYIKRSMNVDIFRLQRIKNKAALLYRMLPSPPPLAGIVLTLSNTSVTVLILVLVIVIIVLINVGLGPVC